MQSLPPFLKIVREVTGDPSFSMFNLSLKEDWSKTKMFCHSLHGKEKNFGADPYNPINNIFNKISDG